MLKILKFLSDYINFLMFISFLWANFFLSTFNSLIEENVNKTNNINNSSDIIMGLFFYLLLLIFLIFKLIKNNKKKWVKMLMNILSTIYFLIYLTFSMGILAVSLFLLGLFYGDTIN